MKNLSLETILVYRQSFDSFLNALERALALPAVVFQCEGRPPQSPSPTQGDLFSCAQACPEYGRQRLAIETNPQTAELFLQRISKAYPESTQELRLAFKSERPLEISALSYLRLAFSGELRGLRDEADPDVKAIRSAARSVAREIHAFMGILRFEVASEGVFEAHCEPDFDILEELLPHFCARFGSSPFRIIDLKRKKEVNNLILQELPAKADGLTEGLGEELSPQEIKALWRGFYASAENPQRRNPQLRLQHMPRRYWKHITELNEETEGDDGCIR